ncbi:MAG TPA: T9SS type A sorting domain-containing protein [Bacteroidia bacterium]|nr:T9SS type A sorting domain-containing protein [Bacteroidia bacterium]
MKNSAILILCLLANLSQADSWTQKADLPGDDRGAAAGFSINGKGYIGTGIKFSATIPFHYDFWEYDPVTNAWTQKADFGGTGRSGAVGFAVLDKGYIACGYDANIIQQDVWEYDPALNTWVQKASLPGPGRDYTVAFVIDSMAYLGTGYDASSINYQDLWQFNPVANAWTVKANVGGGDRSSAVAFSVGAKGYIGAGYNATYMDDFWEYDPVVDSWSQKANIPGGGRSDGAAFAIGNYGYVLTGQFSIATGKDVQRYNPLTNTWTQKLSLTGSARSNSVAFSAGNKGYIGTGYDPSFVSMKDFWEYTPDSIFTSVSEISTGDDGFKIFPNPSDGIINIQYDAVKYFNSTIIFSDVNGRELLSHSLHSLNGTERIDATYLINGIYIYKAVSGKNVSAKGRVLIQK